MRYRKLGNTGLIVSSVALGTMEFGGKMNITWATWARRTLRAW